MTSRRSGLLAMDAERWGLSEQGRLPEAWRDFLETVEAFAPIDELTLLQRERDFDGLTATAAAMNDSLGLALALPAPSVYRRFEAAVDPGAAGLQDADVQGVNARVECEADEATRPSGDWRGRGEPWGERAERLLRGAAVRRRRSSATAAWGGAAAWSEAAAGRSAIVCFEAGGESLAVEAATTAGCPTWRAPRAGFEGPVRQIVVWGDSTADCAGRALTEAAAALAGRYQTTWRIERPEPCSWWRRATGRGSGANGVTFEADEWVICAAEPSGWTGRRRTRRRLTPLLSGCSGPVLILPIGERLAASSGESSGESTDVTTYEATAGAV